MNQVVEQPQRKPALVSGGSIAAIVPQSIEEAYRIANAVVSAGMAPKSLDTPEKAMVAIMHGLEIGMTPMAAMQSIAVVNGFPTIWGDGALGLVRGSGSMEWIKEWAEGESNSYMAFCTVKRKGEPEAITRSFSWDDAKAAGLLGKKGPWENYRSRMFQMRARSYALRDGFADILRGLRIREEVEDYQHTGPDNAKDITPAQPTVMQRLQAQNASQETQERQEGFDRSFVHTESDFASAALSGDIIDQASASAPHETEKGASHVPPLDAPEAGDFGPGSPASTNTDTDGGSVSGEAVGADDLSPEVPAAIDHEANVLFRFARDLLPMAAQEGTNRAALIAVENEYMGEIGKLEDAEKLIARDISKDARAVLTADKPLLEALNKFAALFGCDVTDLGGENNG